MPRVVQLKKKKKNLEDNLVYSRHLVNVYGVHSWIAIALQKKSAHFFWIAPDSKYFRLSHAPWCMVTTTELCCDVKATTDKRAWLCYNKTLFTDMNFT